MNKFRICSLVSTVLMALSSCQKESGSIMMQENQSMAISMPVPCQNSEGDVSSKAFVTISGDDFSTIVQPLNLEACRVTGNIQDIPTGINRQIMIDIYDSKDKLLFTGSAESDIVSGRASSVEIRLHRATGELNVIGVICDDTEPFYTDDYTLALYHLDETEGDELIDENQKWPGANFGALRTSGKFGYCLQFDSSSYARFDTIIPDGMAEGTVELFVMFDSNSDIEDDYIIFGNDGSRATFVYNSGRLYFLKNHSNVFKTVSAEFPFSMNKWHHIAATWGSRGMRLFIDGQLVSSNEDISAYEASPRTTQENVFYIGKKSHCCMGGIGLHSPLTFTGKIDEIRISSIERY